MKNLLNSMKKQGGKSIIYYFIRSEKPPEPSKEKEKEIQILIEQ